MCPIPPPKPGVKVDPRPPPVALPALESLVLPRQPTRQCVGGAGGMQLYAAAAFLFGGLAFASSDYFNGEFSVVLSSGLLFFLRWEEGRGIDPHVRPPGSSRRRSILGGRDVSIDRSPPPLYKLSWKSLCVVGVLRSCIRGICCCFIYGRELEVLLCIYLEKNSLELLTVLFELLR